MIPEFDPEDQNNYYDLIPYDATPEYLAGLKKEKAIRGYRVPSVKVLQGSDELQRTFVERVWNRSAPHTPEKPHPSLVNPIILDQRELIRELLAKNGSSRLPLIKKDESPKSYRHRQSLSIDLDIDTHVDAINIDVRINHIRRPIATYKEVRCTLANAVDYLPPLSTFPPERIFTNDEKRVLQYLSRVPETTHEHPFRPDLLLDLITKSTFVARTLAMQNPEKYKTKTGYQIKKETVRQYIENNFLDIFPDIELNEDLKPISATFTERNPTDISQTRHTEEELWGNNYGNRGTWYKMNRPILIKAFKFEIDDVMQQFYPNGGAPEGVSLLQ